MTDPVHVYGQDLPDYINDAAIGGHPIVIGEGGGGGPEEDTAALAALANHVVGGGTKHTAATITNTPAGNIAATNVQTALNELDTEKASTSHTHTSDTITYTPNADSVEDEISLLLSRTAADLAFSPGGISENEINSGNVQFAIQEVFNKCSPAQALVPGSDISITDNGDSTFTIDYTGGAGGTSDEDIRDAIGDALETDGLIVIAIDDPGNTITFSLDTTTEAERIRDVVGAAITSGTVTSTVNDGANTITLDVNTTSEAERIRDVMGVAMVAGTNMTITVNDGGDTITFDAATGGGGGGTSPYSGAIIVASSEAPAAVKAAAHYTCDGTDDEVQIQAAMLDASALVAHGGTAGAEQGGTVQLTGGRFNIGSDPIKMRTGVQLQGMGRLTELRAVSLTTAADDGGSGTGTALIKLNDATVHNITIRDMYLQGNAASGGDGHAIHLASTSGADRTAYPNSSPDPYIHIDNLYIEGFTGSGTTRHGIWLDTDLRGTIVTRCELRNFTGHGIFIDGTPDSNIVDCHVGGAADTGFRIAGGNVKLSSCKSFYCDAHGFYITSGRGNLVGCESQDDVVGFRITGSPVTLAGCVADTNQNDGFILNANRISLAGFNVFNRGNGRYGSTARGVTFTGTPNNCTIMGNIDPSLITTPSSGSAAGANNFVRIPGYVTVG